jgi:hypothetical protein
MDRRMGSRWREWRVGSREWGFPINHLLLVIYPIHASQGKPKGDSGKFFPVMLRYFAHFTRRDPSSEKDGFGETWNLKVIFFFTTPHSLLSTP